MIVKSSWMLSCNLLDVFLVKMGNRSRSQLTRRIVAGGASVVVGDRVFAPYDGIYYPAAVSKFPENSITLIMYDLSRNFSALLQTAIYSLVAIFGTGKASIAGPYIL